VKFVVWNIKLFYINQYIPCRLQAELVSERERLLDLSRREAAHAAVMSSGLSDKSKGLESRIALLEDKLTSSEAQRLELQQEHKKVESRLEADLTRALTRMEVALADASSERGKCAEQSKLVLDLEKRVSVLEEDLEHEKAHSKDLLLKSNR
jgi:hypothetical protein